MQVVKTKIYKHTHYACHMHSKHTEKKQYEYRKLNTENKIITNLIV